MSFTIKDRKCHQTHLHDPNHHELYPINEAFTSPKPSHPTSLLTQIQSPTFKIIGRDTLHPPHNLCWPKIILLFAPLISCSIILLVLKLKFIGYYLQILALKVLLLKELFTLMSPELYKIQNTSTMHFFFLGYPMCIKSKTTFKFFQFKHLATQQLNTKPIFSIIILNPK